MAVSVRMETSTSEASRLMQSLRQNNTSAKSARRFELHAHRIHYRIHGPFLTKPRWGTDVAVSGLSDAQIIGAWAPEEPQVAAGRIVLSFERLRERMHRT